MRSLVGEHGRGPSTPRPVVLLEHAGSRWQVGPGSEITIGRSSACGIKLPDDTYLSRHMASLRVLDDCVLVYNKSRSKPFSLRPPAGADRIVEPGAALTSLPFPVFDIVAARRGGATVTVRVDASAVTHDREIFGQATLSESRATITRPVFTPAQRNILGELCRPLLTGSGPTARAATYNEIGDRLGLSSAYVRNVVTGIRQNIGDQDGLQLGTWEDLARWLVLNRVITELDLRGRARSRPASRPGV